MGLEADRAERTRLQALATQKIKSDPELKARLRRRLEEHTHDLLKKGDTRSLNGAAADFRALAEVAKQPRPCVCGVEHAVGGPCNGAPPVTK